MQLGKNSILAVFLKHQCPYLQELLLLHDPTFLYIDVRDTENSILTLLILQPNELWKAGRFQNASKARKTFLPVLYEEVEIIDDELKAKIGAQDDDQQECKAKEREARELREEQEQLSQKERFYIKRNYNLETSFLYIAFVPFTCDLRFFIIFIK
ncbi:MAG: hypothetical protein EZS28_027093 [Streblomastix strix]|uniref:Uncharacterized protein n=1 Tax=Streblomastix strix TaxID=222440 RepID=A0A5J4V4V3_9EUKA|nr:MAG: hypothetical protein EZS28_027093 [Streblomastix strix]